MYLSGILPPSLPSDRKVTFGNIILKKKMHSVSKNMEEKKKHGGGTQIKINAVMIFAPLELLI